MTQFLVLVVISRITKLNLGVISDTNLRKTCTAGIVISASPTGLWNKKCRVRHDIDDNDVKGRF